MAVPRRKEWMCMDGVHGCACMCMDVNRTSEAQNDSTSNQAEKVIVSVFESDSQVNLLQPYIQAATAARKLVV